MYPCDLSGKGQLEAEGWLGLAGQKSSKLQVQ